MNPRGMRVGGVCETEAEMRRPRGWAGWEGKQSHEQGEWLGEQEVKGLTSCGASILSLDILPKNVPISCAAMPTL